MRRSGLRTTSVAVITLAGLFAFQPHQARGQNPWNTLNDFKSVSASRIDDRAVVAVLFNPTDKLVAMVVFPAVCRGEDCILSEPGAFVVTDLDGDLVQFFIEPGREATCHPIFASILKGFFVA